MKYISPANKQLQTDIYFVLIYTSLVSSKTSTEALESATSYITQTE